MDIFFTTDGLIALLTLTALETVLGIDNIIFIAILVAKVSPEKQARIRSLGLGLALVMRIGLLFSLSWIMSLKDPFFTILTKSFSGRDLILIGGGLFLIAKATYEIHHKINAITEHKSDSSALKNTVYANATAILMQILILDLVFSLDSVITAVGMADQISIMVAAMVISMLIMLVSAKSISDFVEHNPTIKILALSFLTLIGVMLTAEGMGAHISKGYIYFAIAFSLVVEMINMRVRK